MSDTEPRYFIIVRYNGREYPQLLHDEIPRILLVKGSPLLYCTHANAFGESQTLTQMFDRYCVLRDQGKLPPEYRGPVREKVEQKTGVSRERWKQPPTPWDSTRHSYPPMPGQYSWPAYLDRSVSLKQVPTDKDE